MAISSEVLALPQHTPKRSLENCIRYLRRNGLTMVATLDQRIDRQRELVHTLLKKHRMSVEQLLDIPYNEVEKEDAEIQLLWNILRD